MTRDSMRPVVDVKRAARANPWSEWPRPRSERPGDLLERALAAPAVVPGFALAAGEQVFTLGSCFTRSIEDRLVELGFVVPCQAFGVPDAERTAPRPNSVLNQYVPTVMLQELRRAAGGDPSDSERCLVAVGAGDAVDMQLFAPPAVPWERAVERRHEVEALYRRALDSDAAIITLGQTEAWWDRETDLYCNQLPTGAVVNEHPGRFWFRPLDLDDVVGCVAETCELLLAGRVDRILLTVSPVPISRAWGQRDALAGYVYTKSLLRVAAEHVAAGLPAVDYFPSYDMVALSDRSVVFAADRMHVREPIVAEIVERMTAAYVR